MEVDKENIHMVGRIASMQGPPSMRDIREFLSRMQPFWSDKGFANFVNKEIHRVKDSSAIMRYLNICQGQKKFDELERVMDVSDAYDPQEFYKMLKRSNPPNPKGLYKLCVKHNIELDEHLKRYEINDNFDLKRLCLHNQMKGAGTYKHKIESYNDVTLDFLREFRGVL